MDGILRVRICQSQVANRQRAMGKAFDVKSSPPREVGAMIARAVWSL
jgi:hypothetical protein